MPTQLDSKTKNRIINTSSIICTMTSKAVSTARQEQLALYRKLAETLTGALEASEFTWEDVDNLNNVSETCAYANAKLDSAQALYKQANTLRNLLLVALDALGPSLEEGE